MNVWGAPYSTHGISFRALHPVFASPWRRSRPAVRGHPPRAQRVLGAMRPLLDYPELIPVVMEAMVAARLPGAEGLAARAVANPYDRPPKDIPADPRLW